MNKDTPIIRTAMLLLLACYGCAAAVPAWAEQHYPRKPIRMLTAAPGGAADFMARLVAQGLTKRLGQQVIVDNRGAASGAIAGGIVAQAEPDGYTLLFYGPSIWLLPFLHKHVPFDPMKDFAPVSLVVTQPDVLVVEPSVPAKSVQQLIALAKAKPGALNFATGGTGSATHLSGELFKSMAGINIVRIPYRGTGAALNALLGNQVQMMFPAIAVAMPHVKAGKLRALAVTSAHRTPLAPQLPTIAQSGLPGYQSVLILGMFAPAKTPARIVRLLSHEVARVLAEPQTKHRIFAAGAEPVGSSPQQFAATLKANIAKWGRILRAAHVHDD